MHDAFAELRSLCQKPHSERVWQEILNCLKTWPDEQSLVDMAVPYASAHLNHWPDDYKNVDYDTIDQLREGHIPPYMPVFRHLGAVDRHATDRISLPNVHAHIDEDLDWITGSPSMRHLRSLNLRNHHLTSEDLMAIIKSEHLQNLELLDLGGNHLPATALNQAFSQMTFPNLKTLSLWRNHVDDSSALTLSQNPCIDELIDLEFGQTYVGEDGYKAIAQSPYLNKLETLCLWKTEVTLEGLRALLKSPNWGNLRELELSSAELTAQQMRLFAEYDTLAQLKWLTLGDNTALGDSAPLALADSSMKHIEELRLNSINMTDDGFATLCAAEHAHAWKNLSIYSNPIPRAGFLLAEHEHISNLQGINMWGTQATIESIKALLDAPHLTELHRLWISDHVFKYSEFKTLFEGRNVANIDNIALLNCTLGPHSMRALAKAPFATLKRLSMSNNPIKDSGFKNLTKAPFFSSIKHLDVRYCQLTGQSAIALAETDGMILDTLQIRNNILSLDSIQYLLNSPIVRQLSYLDIIPSFDSATSNRDVYRLIIDNDNLPTHIRLEHRRNMG